jgi:hypothetical protein
MSIRKYIFPVAVALLSLSACGSEDALTPSNADVNGFAPAASDNSATAQLRNAFYKETGSYLLFNDTLNATDTQGNPELFDASYAMTGTGSVDSYNYKYSYITDVTEQQKFAEDVKTYLLNKLGKAKPFSFFLVNDISYTNSYGRTKHVNYLLATRGYVLSTNNGAMYDDPESYFSGMLANIIIDKFGRLSSSVSDPFYAYSKTMYGEYLSDHNIDATVENVEWQYGFLEKFEDIWGGTDYNFPYETRDLTDWVNVVLTMTRDEFVAKYGSQQIMVNKFDTIKGIIEQMGFNI